MFKFCILLVLILIGVNGTKELLQNGTFSNTKINFYWEYNCEDPVTQSGMCNGKCIQTQESYSVKVIFKPFLNSFFFF